MKIKFSVMLITLLLLPSIATAGKTVYVALGSGNQVVAIDAETDTVIESYTGVDNPHGLVGTPDGEYLVAGSLSEKQLPKGTDPETPNSELALIHLVHKHVMSTIPVTGWTHHQAITPNGRYVLSTHATRGNVSVVDLQQNKVVATIPTGPAPNYTVITKDGKTAYVSNTGNNTISIIDTSTWKVTGTLQSGPGPEHLVLSQDENDIFVTNPRSGQVSQVSISEGKVTRTWDIGDNVHGLDIGDDGKTLYASAKKGDKFAAIDTANGSVSDIQLSPQPYHLNTIMGTGKVYVSSRKLPKIWVIDQQSLEVLKEIQLPAGEGHQMVIMDSSDG
jgi:YVTN family beta-propeller protein